MVWYSHRFNNFPQFFLIHAIKGFSIVNEAEVDLTTNPDVIWILQSKVKVAQSCPTLCDPMDCSLPGSSLHGILQARILDWVAVPFSRESFQPRDQTQVSHITGRFFTI